MARVELVTPSSTRLLTVEQAKLHCRCQNNLEDSAFSDWIKSAEAYVQDYTRRALLSSTWQWIGEEFPTLDGEDAPIDLLISPVQSIVSVTYSDENGDEQTLETDEWQLEGGLVPKLYPGIVDEWPATEAGNVAAVTVVMTAGYASTDLVPAQFTQAMKLLVGEWFVNRDVTSIPAAVHALLDQVVSERYR